MKNNIFYSLLYNGLPENANLREKYQSAVLNSISVISVIILIYFTYIDILQDKKFIAIFTTITALTITASIVIVGLTKKLIIGKVYVTLIAFSLFSFLIYSSGPERAGYFWIVLFPLVSIFFLGLRAGSILTIIFGITSVIFIFKIPGMVDIPVIIPMGIRAIGAYIGVSCFTVAYELIRNNTFQQLEKTSGDLLSKRKQTTMILNNVKQGIFLLDENLDLEDERSTYFNELFKGVETSHSFLDLIEDKIPQLDFNATKDYLELFFNNTVNPELLRTINPLEKILMNFGNDKINPNQNWLEFDFERIVLEDGKIQILGLFKNITEQVLLEEQLNREETESSKKMENLFQIIHVSPELMDEFLKDTEDEIKKINDILKVETDEISAVINHIFAIVHGIKGNALLLGLNSIGNKLTNFEEFIKELKQAEPTWRELLHLTINLAELKQETDGIKELIDKIVSFQSKIGDSQKNRKYIFEETLKKAIRRLAADYDKEIILDLEEYNNEIIPDKYRRLFKDSITQLVRNSIVHGIETKEERVDNRKKPEGKISISLKEKKNNLEFIFKDD
ncbi:MAG: Hpt domain-containing protein, partial [Spirochaetaceae bacterium]|nr:Hpt domain-containing protein [Spirochaetaceae bacterium]